MITLQKAGGAAALVQALAYIAGFGMLATFLNPGDTESWSSLQKLIFVMDRKAGFQLWMIFIYVVFGIALVVLTVAIHERLKDHSSELMLVATPFGLIWSGLVIASGMIASVGVESAAALYAEDPSQAASLWLNVGVLQKGLGGGVEIVGGLWMLLISFAALRLNAFTKVVNYLGMLAGIAGLLTIVPPLADFGAVFGLGQIVWFIWIGLLLFRESSANSLFKPNPLRG